MPTYEYRCPDGHEFENFVLRISAAKTELPCPTCGAVAPRRMSAGSGLLFKGSGFYITDYGKDGKKDQRAAAADKSDSKGEAGAKGDTGAKSDTGSGTSGGDAKATDKSGSAPASGAPTTSSSSTSASSAPKSNAPAPSAPKPPKSGSSE